jgi:ribosomal protein S27AE
MFRRKTESKTDLKELEAVENRVDRPGSLEPFYIKNALNPSYQIVTEEEERGLYSIPDVQRIINLLIKDVKELKPSFDLQYSCRYPQVEAVTELEANKIPGLLDRLTKYRVLDSHFNEKIIVCDKCSSPNIATRFLCSHCKSTNIVQKRTVHHLTCGYVCPEDQLILDADGVSKHCPRCGVILEFNGGPDVRINEGWFVCNDCSKASRDPLIFFFCRTCERLISVSDTTFMNLYSYTLSKSFNSDTVVLHEPYRELVRQLGFQVQSPGKMIGNSGVEYLFDIVASKDKKSIAINIVYSDVIVTDGPLVKMFGAVFDCKPTKSILIAIPESAESISLLARQYGITLISGNDQKLLVDTLKEEILTL